MRKTLCTATMFAALGLNGCGIIPNVLFLKHASIAHCGGTGQFVDFNTGETIKELYFGSRGPFCESWATSPYWDITYRHSAYNDELVEARVSK